jgi:hypothetical protein
LSTPAVSSAGGPGSAAEVAVTDRVPFGRGEDESVGVVFDVAADVGVEFVGEEDGEDDVAFLVGLWRYPVESPVDFAEGAFDVEASFQYVGVVAVESDSFGPSKSEVAHH